MAIGILKNLQFPKVSFDNNTSKSPRFHSIDIARGFAVTLMIQAHLILFISYSGSLNIVALLFSPAPFFLIIAGLSFDLFFQSRLNKKIEKYEINTEIITRAVILVLIDVIMLFLGSLLWPSLYSFKIYFGVFQVIAAGYLIGLFIPKKIIFIIISLLILSAFEMVFSILNNDLLFGLSTTLIPMLIYFQLGRGLFYLYKRDNHSMIQETKNLFGLLVLSISFSFILFLYFQIKISEIVQNRYSLLLIAFIFTNVLILILVLKILENKLCFFIRLLKPFERMGKIAFTIYFFNIVIIYCFIIFTSRVFPNISMPINSQILFLLCFFALIVLLSLFEKYWEKYNYFLGLEWIFRTCSKFVVKHLTDYLLK
jgi:hypothetical protein